MGLLRWLFGSREVAEPAQERAQILFWRGSGDFDFDIVGESRYQDALDQICGGKTEDGHEKECVAILTPEPTNPHDRNAIAVYIDDQKVGYLSRSDAIDYWQALHALPTRQRAICCNAVIVGGWRRKRNGSDGSFGVKLDLDWPPQLENSGSKE